MAAHRDMYIRGGKVVKDLSLIGHKAVGIPGLVAGLLEVHHRFGFDVLINIDRTSGYIGRTWDRRVSGSGTAPGFKSLCFKARIQLFEKCFLRKAAG